MGKRTQLECPFVHRKQGLFLSVYGPFVQMAGKMQIMAPMWKKLMKNEDLGESTSFLDMCIWDALNVNVNRTKLV